MRSPEPRISNTEISNYLNSEDALFHYTKCSTAIEKVLNFKTLKLSRVSNFSDYKESQKIYTTFAIFLEESSNSSKIYDDFHSSVDSIIKDAQVSCFCSNSFKLEGQVIPIVHSIENYIIKKQNELIVPQPGYKKDRMWEQYGENHNGICLVFSKKKIESIITQQGNDFVFDYLNYVRNYFGNISKPDVNVDIKQSAKQHAKNKIFTKSFDYRDESEYRLAIFNVLEEIYLPIENCLFGVILGYKLNKVYQELISKQLKSFTPIHTESKVYLMQEKIYSSIPYHEISEV